MNDPVIEVTLDTAISYQVQVVDDTEVSVSALFNYPDGTTEAFQLDTKEVPVSGDARLFTAQHE